MTTEEWFIFVDFLSHVLYMFVAFMSGLIIGYLIGSKNSGEM